VAIVAMFLSFLTYPIQVEPYPEKVVIVEVKPPQPIPLTVSKRFLPLRNPKRL
jgi:hypothetical protein